MNDQELRLKALELAISAVPHHLGKNALNLAKDFYSFLKKEKILKLHNNEGTEYNFQYYLSSFYISNSNNLELENTDCHNYFFKDEYVCTIEYVDFYKRTIIYNYGLLNKSFSKTLNVEEKAFIVVGCTEEISREHLDVESCKLIKKFDTEDFKALITVTMCEDILINDNSQT